MCITYSINYSIHSGEEDKNYVGYLYIANMMMRWESKQKGMNEKMRTIMRRGSSCVGLDFCE